MTRRNTMKFGLCCWTLAFGLIYGCTYLGTFNHGGTGTAIHAVMAAQGLLKALDGFYGDLLAWQQIPEYRSEATRALAIADEAAGGLKEILAQKKAREETLTVAAGQVDEAKAMLNQIGGEN